MIFNPNMYRATMPNYDDYHSTVILTVILLILFEKKIYVEFNFIIFFTVSPLFYAIFENFPPRFEEKCGSIIVI